MEVEIGRTYKVVIRDCCVEGEFTSKLVSAKAYDGSNEMENVSHAEYGTTVVFENGVTLEMNGGVSLEEA